MLNALTPMFTFLVGVALFGTRVKSLQVVGLVVGLVGAGILAFQPGMGSDLESGMTWGAGRVVLATAFYGVSVNTIRNKLSHVPPAAVASLALALVGLPALAVALTGPGAELVAGHPDGLRGLAAVVVLAVVGTGLALIAFNRIIQRTNALFASTVTYIIPIFAIMWGWLDDEPLTFLHLVGGLVVLAGVRLVNRGGK
jgi:drug/metabolite transporter (DMT)-like permease